MFGTRPAHLKSRLGVTYNPREGFRIFPTDGPQEEFVYEVTEPQELPACGGWELEPRYTQPPQRLIVAYYCFVAEPVWDEQQEGTRPEILVVNYLIALNPDAARGIEALLNLSCSMEHVYGMIYSVEEMVGYELSAKQLHSQLCFGECMPVSMATADALVSLFEACPAYQLWFEELVQKCRSEFSPY